MKLYRVEVSKVLYIVAKDEDKAQLEAWRYAEDDGQIPSMQVDLATPAGIASDEWGGGLVYHNGEDDLKIEDAIKLNDPKNSTVTG